MNRVTETGRWQPGEVLAGDGGRRALIRGWRGEGSYARVYLGEELSARTPCAVKVAKQELDEALPRLERECEVLRRFNHARIVSLLDAGRHGGTAFILLEWLEGETLFDLVRKKRRLPLRQALEYLEAICEGLAQFAAAGVDHGDLRPQNIIVTARGPVLTDPGSLTPGSQAADVRAAGELFHWMLMGAAPDPAQPRLVPGAGLNPKAVTLWDRTQSPLPPAAPSLLDEVRRLRQSL